jgi:uncharacterized integral membrane protein (TIGR00697 family)
VSTFVSQVLDIAIFTFIAFFGVFPVEYMLKIFMTSFVLRTMISVLDTPFVYWSVSIKKKVKEI